MFIAKKRLLRKLKLEKDKNVKFKNTCNGSVQGAVFLGKEIALQEVISYLLGESYFEVDIETYLIDWKETKEEKDLKNILISLSNASKKGDAELLKITKELLDIYVEKNENTISTV